MKRRMRRTFKRIERGFSQAKSITVNFVRSRSTTYSYPQNNGRISSTLSHNSTDSEDDYDDRTSDDAVFEPTPLENSSEDITESSDVSIPCEFCQQQQSSTALNRHQLTCTRNPLQTGRTPTNRRRISVERRRRRAASDSTSPVVGSISPAPSAPVQPRSASPTEGFPKPDELLCPITHALFCDPVVASDGHTYERAAIFHWLQREKTSPVTRNSMSVDQLLPNRLVAQLVDKFRAECKRKRELYKYKLDVDIRKTERSPYIRTSTRSIYQAEWIEDHSSTKSNVELILLTEDGAENMAYLIQRIGTHPNIVPVFGAVEQNAVGVLLAQEAAPTEKLSKFMMKPPQRLSVDIVDVILYQIASALQFLSAAGVVHGNVTADNVLIYHFDALPENILVKITNICNHEKQPNDSDADTTAPDVPSKDSHSEHSDFYAFCELAQAMYSLQLETDDQTLAERLSLIENCLAKDPKDRPNFDDLVKRLKDLIYENDSTV